MRILRLNNINDIQRETGVSVVKRARVIGHNTVCRYKLLEELPIQLTNGEYIVIPVGFEFDISSTPRLIWTFLPFDGDFDLASCIHDFLYQTKRTSRAFADLEMYKWSVVTNGTQNLISLRNLDNVVRYLGCVIFGWWVYYRVGKKISNKIKKVFGYLKNKF